MTNDYREHTVASLVSKRHHFYVGLHCEIPRLKQLHDNSSQSNLAESVLKIWRHINGSGFQVVRRGAVRDEWSQVADAMGRVRTGERVTVVGEGDGRWEG